VGGYSPSFNYNYILESYNEIDSLIIGEGEITFVELINKIVSGKIGEKLMELHIKTIIKT